MQYGYRCYRIVIVLTQCVRMLDRTLPAAVHTVAVSSGAHEVWFLYKDRVFTTLFDTGCDTSCIDESLAAELGISVRAMPGKIKLAHAVCLSIVSVERLSRCQSRPSSRFRH